MRVRLRRPSVDPAIREAFTRLHLTHPHGLPNIEALKRSVSLEEMISFHLEAEPDIVRGEHRWHCPPRIHGHVDVNPSLWAHDNYRGTGVGRWGCNSCGASGDVYDFLERLHGFTKPEAFREVKVWHTNHRSIRIRLPKRKRARL
jgi:hypothetical protein